MAVQFKFRSSVNFESVAIDGRASISVRDLKSKIIRHKNLNLCQDSELVFSDAVTGQEYNDESIQIPCGSSVVIKRVPAGSVHVNQPHFNSCQNLHSKDSVDAKSPAAPNAETVDFDDFGVDLYPIPKETLFSSDLDTDKDNFIYDYQPNTDNGIKRYSEPAMRRCLKLEASGISDAIPGVHAHSGVEQIILPTKSKPEEEDMNVERVGSANALDTQHANLSSELKCSLCNVQHPNAFSWNAAIRGYSESKNPREAIVLYKKMLRNGGSRPDNYTYPLLMKVCANLSLSFVGGEVLGHVMQLGLYLDIFVHNAVIHMLVSCRELEAAQKVFDESCVRDLVSWNSLINGYVRCGLACEALRIYREMEVEGVMPDEVTMIGVVSSCAQLEDLSIGRQFHWLIEENGLSLTIPLANVLMDMYVKCGNLEVARALFDNMKKKTIVSWTTMIFGYAKYGFLEIARRLLYEIPEKNVVPWNAMISGYVQAKHGKEALALFHEMQARNIRPNEITMVGCLSACSQIGALEVGIWIHHYIEKQALSLNVALGTALVDMYAKCGNITEALKVFWDMPGRNSLTWTAIICGLAHNGHAHDAITYFAEMIKTGLEPDEITFLGVLSACCHGGLVEEGRKYISLMKSKFNLCPKVKHYSCMVDLLGRAGLLREAEELINSMPIKADAGVWGALFFACYVHKNVLMGERAASKLLELDPCDGGIYILLGKIYRESHMWEKAENIQNLMKERGVEKSPGCSSIEVNGIVYEFIVRDKSHPQSKHIYDCLIELTRQMDLYLPNI